MITVGYGDIHPYTWQEQLYCIFTMILANGVFGYTMNTIIGIIQLDVTEEENLAQ